LFYATSKWVDVRNKLEERVDKLKNEGKPFSDENTRMRQALKICDLLTPMTKYFLSEASNKISYDALQIHGGAGYMKDFIIERLYRDARITNIYEGTSQLQIVAATGGVINDLLGEYFEEKEKKTYKGTLTKLANHLKEIREIYLDCLRYITDKQSQINMITISRKLQQKSWSNYIHFYMLDIWF